MNRNIAVGIFSLAGLTLFATGLFMIGSRQEAFSKHFAVYAEFTDLSGLAKGSTVQVAGMAAGKVEDIRVPTTPAEKFRLRLRLDEKTHGIVRTDSLASIATAGVVGDTFLSIAQGSANRPVVPAYATLPSKEAVQLSDLVKEANATIGDVDTTVKNVNVLLAHVGGNLNQTLTTARGSLLHVNDLISGVQRGDGTIGMLLRDPKTAASVRQSLVNVRATTQSLQHASVQIDDTLTALHARNLPEQIGDTINSVRDASSRIDATSKDAQSIVAELVEPDEHGETVGGNIRETLSNADVASVNLTEDTEALKHNFLTKGYFRHRGFFSLSGMTPSAYRENATFNSTKNIRVWLTKSSLFEQTREGSEQLSQEGLASIDAALDGHAELLEGTPLVVEGYATGTSETRETELSRERALLVRNYLVKRYRLDPTTVGVIGLGKQPVRQSDHPSFDGISLVFLHQR